MTPRRLAPIVLEHCPKRVRLHGGAVFLDRDGVLIENLAGHVRSRSDVAVLPGVTDALRRLASAGLASVVVSNQSVVGRGIVDEATMLDTHRFAIAAVSAGAQVIDASYLCPHTPDEGCRCRKPSPGMITEAANRLGIDLQKSVLVGDAMTDVLAARSVFVPSVLTLSGRGQDQLGICRRRGVTPTAIFDDLRSATDWIIDRTTGHDHEIGPEAGRHE
jgi:D-glycero-D-manno-heptose 1,7-bisphosphate phosphatase